MAAIEQLTSASNLAENSLGIIEYGSKVTRIYSHLKPGQLGSVLGIYSCELIEHGHPDEGEVVDLEVENMVELGDPAEEVREEMLPYAASSRFIIARSIYGGVAGMLRFVPFNGKLKTVEDIASIETNKALAYPIALEQGRIDEWNNKYEVNLQQALSHVAAQINTADLTQVWDIPTLGTDMNESRRGRDNIAQELISQFTRICLKSYFAGDLQDVTAYNDVNANEYFRGLGYPFMEINGYGATIYDSFGTGIGMIAIPSVLSLRNVHERIEQIASHDIDLEDKKKVKAAAAELRIRPAAFQHMKRIIASM